MRGRGLFCGEVFPGDVGDLLLYGGVGGAGGGVGVGLRGGGFGELDVFAYARVYFLPGVLRPRPATLLLLLMLLLSLLLLIAGLLEGVLPLARNANQTYERCDYEKPHHYNDNECKKC